MNLPVQITFRNMEPSPWVEDRIREEAAELDRFFDHITSCRVMVETPHRHHHMSGRQYHVRIELGVPGTELVVSHEPSLHGDLSQRGAGAWRKHLETNPEHKDAYLAIHDAFKDARRRLKEYARKLRGNVKKHSRVNPARRDKLAAEGVDGIQTDSKP